MPEHAERLPDEPVARTENDALDWLIERTFREVRAWAWSSNQKLARQVVHALQRMPSTATFEEYSHRSQWDEYCHEMQEGPSGLVHYAFETMIEAHIEYVLSRLNEHDSKLLTAAAIDEFDEYRDLTHRLAPRPDLMARAVKEELDRLAMHRDLTRFLPAELR